MIGKFLSFTAVLVAATVFSASAASQVARIPKTGCPNAAYPTPAGSPGLGKGFGVTAGPCRTRGAARFIVIGTAGLNVALPVPLACGRACILGCRPIIVLYATSLRVLIPRDRSLVGQKVCIQTGCIENASPKCIYLHGALSVTITP